MNRPRLLSWLLPLLLAPVAQGQALPDPTRPAIQADAPAAAGEGMVTPSSGLQSVILRRGQPPAAIINGEYVVLGGKIGDGRLVRVGDDFVVIAGPAGKDTLTLTPGIEKKPAAVAAREQKAVHRRNTARKKAKKNDD